jgi:hypothetical protein
MRLFSSSKSSAAISSSSPEEKRVERFDTLEHMCAWLVVVGIIVEYLPRFIKWFQSPTWGTFQDITGGVILTLGIAGEILFGRKASSAEKKIRDDAKLEIERLRARAAEAERQTADLQIEIANAREQQATAERLLVDLRLDQMPRSATFNKLKFASALESDLKGSAEIMYPRQDAEAHAFAEDLVKCFVLAHWDVPHGATSIPEHPFDTPPAILVAGGTPVGITVRANSGVNEWPLKTVVDAFNLVAEQGGRQYRVFASLDGTLPQGRVRIVVGPKF